jgi:hypothetical protein
MLFEYALSSARRRRGFRIRVAAAQPRSDGDFLDQAREDLAALGVLSVLAMLGIGPLAVTGHGKSRVL